jgi:LCP family protein required for cell wall assembly
MSATGTHLSRLLRVLVLGLVLAVAAAVVPDSAVKSTELNLVKVHRAEGVDLNPDVVWILAVGSDARPGQDMLRSRGDALQLVGLNAKTGAATAIGIPRDSWVSIPGYGSNKVNAALAFGGPDLLGRAVGNLVGIQPDYVFVSRFPFFIEMVREIGGIEVSNPRSFSDPDLLPSGFAAGRIHLGPYEAMAFARIRHNLARGDFDRSANQQRVLRVERGVMSVLAHLRTDLPPTELFRLAEAMAQVDPAKITNCVVQGSIGSAGGASVVLPFTDQARRYGNDARTDATIGRC